MTPAVDFSVLDHKGPDWFISRQDANLLRELSAHVSQWRNHAQDDLEASLIGTFAAALAYLCENRRSGGHYIMQATGQLPDDKEGHLTFELTPEHVLMRRIVWPIGGSETSHSPSDDGSEMILDIDGSYNVEAAKAFFHFSLALMQEPVPPRVLIHSKFSEVVTDDTEKDI